MRRHFFHACALAVAMLFMAASGCRMAEVAFWKPLQPPSVADYAVDQWPGIPYYDGPGADPKHHRLDLFLPRGKRDFPVLVLIHGGVWMWGDKRSLGLYSSVGEFLASQGVGVVLANYRLSPAVKHPEHVKDVARALAWTRAHIARFGGNPDRLFLAGHSAGGHLAALAATDATYLLAEGMEPAQLRGVITTSGVYRIPEKGLEVTLGGPAPQAFWPDQVMPPRSERSWAWAKLAWVPGIPVNVDLFRPVFDLDPEVRRQASPLTHVRPGLPPFLVIVAENDLPTLPEMADEFHAALVRKGCEVQFLRMANRNHCSVLFRAVHNDDPVAQAMLDFIRQHGADSRHGQTPTL